jgi:hypothetical protein
VQLFDLQQALPDARPQRRLGQVADTVGEFPSGSQADIL